MLVIIGLLVGGVLVGQDLVRAAGIRAQISQIEKYNTAVNTFRGKYNALPGDINAITAAQFGFTARGSFAGQGDGNGVIEGVKKNQAGKNVGFVTTGGETEMFWVDLTTANGLNTNLIEGGFSQNKITSPPATIAVNAMVNYMPTAKIGNGNYVYVWSGGWSELANGLPNFSDSINYFGLSAVLGSEAIGFADSNVSLTVKQAYEIDKKVDDGMPQMGRVLAMFDNVNTSIAWAAGGGNDVTGTTSSGDSDVSGGTYGPVVSPADIGAGMPAGVNSCFDGSRGLPEQYSTQISNGSNTNCALSFKFQ